MTLIETLPDDVKPLVEQCAVEARQILADWLIEQGDPWGTFIAVGLDHARIRRGGFCGLCIR